MEISTNKDQQRKFIWRDGSSTTITLEHVGKGTAESHRQRGALNASNKHDEAKKQKRSI